MNRKIRYRGRCIDSPAWLYGDAVLARYYPKSYIVAPGIKPSEVERETVSVFLGIKDSLGMEIFEGDIIRCDYLGSDGKILRSTVWEAGWNAALFRFALRNVADATECFSTPIGNIVCQRHHCVVIGNRWDNPELLHGGKE